jgi:hypothetical protein
MEWMNFYMEWMNFYMEYIELWHELSRAIPLILTLHNIYIYRHEALETDSPFAVRFGL